MKKVSAEKIILITAVVVLLIGAAIVILLGRTKETGTEAEAKSDIRMFSEFTNVEIFQDIPAMYVENTKIGTASDYGSGNYLIDVNGTTKEDYDAYVKVLEKEGFKKFCDNGEEGMDGYVYASYFTRDSLVLTLSQVVNLEKTYISVSESVDMQLSEHMIYKDEYVADISADAKTSLHMLELNNNGNCFIIQLKNGHFIIEDGGIEQDAPYLLDYLESLTPGDEKPVVEAWFISHAHGDHYQALKKIYTEPEYVNRLIVNGIYFTEPGPEANALYGSAESGGTWFVKQAAKQFTAEDGGKSNLYRTQLGQRYYFCDIVIDVCFTLEQVTIDANHTKDFNDTSTWLMHHIEGQKFLHAGDAGVSETKLAMMLYDKEYFNMEVFAVLHHGINMFNYFADYCTIKTALYTNRRNGSLWEDGSKYAREAENAYFQSTVQECLSHGNGTVVLTFPYTVGSAKIMEPCDWRYNGGEPYRSLFQ